MTSKMSNSFYMYLSNNNADHSNKAISTNIVPYYSSPITPPHEEWKVAVLHGKLSKTWNTIPDINCKIWHTVAPDKTENVKLSIKSQRLEKTSEMTAKLREELNAELVYLDDTSDNWVKFGGQGAASRKITVQPGVKITFSRNLNELLDLEKEEYDNLNEKKPLIITIGLDYLKIKNYDILYLMCNEIQGVYSNNKIMNILTDITTDSKLIDVGGSIEFTCSSPIYHRWTGGNKTRMQTYFANSSGEVLQMNEGFTFVLLHFIKDN